jgi:heat shock protein HtpX
MAAPAPASVGRPRNLFEEQARNRRTTWLLIFGFVGFLAFLGFGFDLFVLGVVPTSRVGGATVPVPLAATAAAAFGSISAWVSLRFGDRMVLASSQARAVRPDDPYATVLMNVVHEMAIAAGLPLPRVYVVDDPDPNAFATGRDPAHASIAVTTGLLMTMSRDELQGVIAHEMAHVRNLDIRKMTIVAALLGGVLLLTDWATRVRIHGPSRGRSSDSDRGGGLGPLGVVVFVIWLLAIVLAPIIGQLLATAVSRSREYLADASGAELTRNPLGLAGALRKLAAARAPTVKIARGTAHLCITDPLARAIDHQEGRLADLLATHPPIEDRIARLEQMAYLPGRGGAPA